MCHPVSALALLFLADVFLTGDQGPQGSRFPASAHLSFVAITEDLKMEIQAAEMRRVSKHRL